MTHVFAPPVEGGDDVGITIVVERKNGMMTRFDVDFDWRMFQGTDEEHVVVSRIYHHLIKERKGQRSPEDMSNSKVNVSTFHRNSHP